MTVNPFWFGVLMTIFAIMVFVIATAYIQTRRSERDDDDEKEDRKD